MLCEWEQESGPIPGAQFANLTLEVIFLSTPAQLSCGMDRQSKKDAMKRHFKVCESVFF